MCRNATSAASEPSTPIESEGKRPRHSRESRGAPPSGAESSGDAMQGSPAAIDQPSPRDLSGPAEKSSAPESREEHAHATLRSHRHAAPARAQRPVVEKLELAL